MKLKKILKSKIFIFIITALLFSVVGVSAATYFESGAVTYDNTESGLTSTNVQGAIDELYVKAKQTSGGSDDKVEDMGGTVSSGDGLYADSYESGRYFYRGANPNNYITFNGEKAGWKIISVECDGRIKIMKIANINTSNNLVWDWDTSSSPYGNNNWARPATLNTYLNGTYYNGLNSAAKSQIISSNFSIGAVDYNNNMSMQVTNENSNKWYGNIALPTVSEYIRTNSNKSSCGTFSLINDNYSSCVNTGWMDITSANYWWTLTPFSGYSSAVFYVSLNGYVDSYEYFANTEYGAVRPALFLSSEVKLSGSGTQSDPYVVS